MKEFLKKLLVPKALANWELSANLRLRYALEFDGHEIVFVNTIFGHETVYLDGEVVSEKSNFFSVRSIHNFLLNGETYQLRLYSGLATPNLGLYKGLHKLETKSVSHGDGWVYFFSVLFILGLITGYLAGRFFFMGL